MLHTGALKAARLAGGLSLREVADVAQVDPSAICHYESGRVRPSPGALARWQAGLFGLLRSRQQAIHEALNKL